MDKQHLTNSYNSIQEWAKWLVTIETAICAGLWPKLTDLPRPPITLYMGWIMFVGSILTAAIMLGVIAFYHQRIELFGEKDTRNLRIFVFIQYGFFFAGILFFIIRLVGFGLGL
jgi:hypothetical protein